MDDMIKNISVKTAPNGRTPPIIDIKIVCKNLAQQILWSLATSAGKSSDIDRDGGHPPPHLRAIG